MHPSTTLGPRGLPLAYQVRDLRIEPAVVLAPMEGVTDLAFRRLIRSIGGTGMTWTEFIPSEGIARGEDRWLAMAELDPDEHPICIQIYGRRPDAMAEAARAVQDMGATVVDINMGCPSKKVCAHSGGSALMREPELVASIVRAVRAVVQVPLTVKMRSGFDASQRNAPEIARICQEEGAEAVTIHWRTRADLYGGDRAVDKIAETVQGLSIPVVGNGDIVDVQTAEAMLRQTGCDGLMIGRGALKDPWIFRTLASWLRGEEPAPVTAEDRRQALQTYLDECRRHFAVDRRNRGRKHDPDRAALGRFKQLCKYFLADLPGAEDARSTVLRSPDLATAEATVHTFFEALPPWPDAPAAAR